MLDWQEEELRSAEHEQVGGAHREVKDTILKREAKYGLGGFIRRSQENSCALCRVLAI